MAKTPEGDGKKKPGDPVPTHILMLSPEAQNAAAMLAWFKQFGEPKIEALIHELLDKTKAVADGDMRQVEAMLYGQAATLQNLFTNLLRRAAGQEGVAQSTAMLTLGLKAQAQCRSTLETLAEIKNPRPPVAFVGQANIANGPQQVNNATNTRPPARTEQDQVSQNRLLEATNGQRLDTRTQGAAGDADPVLEAVGAVERATHG
jgi:hypothetical protein